MVKLLDAGEELIINDHIGVLRNGSVRWLWNAYNMLNKPDLVKKVSNMTQSNLHLEI